MSREVWIPDYWCIISFRKYSWNCQTSQNYLIIWRLWARTWSNKIVITSIHDPSVTAGPSKPHFLFPPGLCEGSERFSALLFSVPVYCCCPSGHGALPCCGSTCVPLCLLLLRSPSWASWASHQVSSSLSLQILCPLDRYEPHIGSSAAQTF